MNHKTSILLRKLAAFETSRRTYESPKEESPEDKEKRLKWITKSQYKGIKAFYYRLNIHQRAEFKDYARYKINLKASDGKAQV